MTVAQTPEKDLTLRDQRDVFFEQLYYSAFPKIAKLIRKGNGTLEDAKDVFHDALIMLYEKKISGLVIQSDEAYVIGISKNLWIKKSALYSQTVLLKDYTEVPEENIHPTANDQSILRLLETVGKKCMSLLRAFYYEKKSLDVISNSFGFASVRSATVQKFKCLEKVREIVKQEAKTYEDFTE